MSSLSPSLAAVKILVFANFSSGWLPEPDSRPNFTDISQRLENMLQDPLRFILTTRDGLINNYDNLPTNISTTAEFNYENPFTQSLSAASNSLEWNQAYGAHTNHPNSQISVLPTIFANGAAEYDDVIAPQADTFDKVRNQICSISVNYCYH